MTDLTKFRDLGLSETMLNALHAKGFEEPTPIQAKAIPFLLNDNRDLIGKAQTGTGKTAAFGIPLIEKIIPNAKKVQAIILVPTRELALQVTEEINSFAHDSGLRILAVYGGQPIGGQSSALRKGVDIVVGTPGRVIDHLDRGSLDISLVSYVVLDEADEMLNMGFIEDIESILKAAPKNRRTILFSATMPDHIKRLAERYMSDYEIISIISEQVGRDNIQQIYFEVSQSDKFEALYRIIDSEEHFYGMIFCRTKIDTDEVALKLTNRGCHAEAIHGDLSQVQREKVLSKFRNKQVKVLVATDVAARGIDVENLTHVINFSLPQDPESYTHRIGRTGRAGKKGVAITLITPSEYRKLISIERIANAKITKHKIPDVAKIISNKKQRVRTSILEIVGNDNYQDTVELANEVIQDQDPQIIVAALLKLFFKEELNAENYSEIGEASRRSGGGSDRGFSRGSDRGDRGFDRGGDRGERRNSYNDSSSDGDSARFFCAKGKQDGFDKRALVDFIQRETGVSQRNINDVRIMDGFSFFAVPNHSAQQVLQAFQKGPGGRSLVSRAKDRR